MKQLIHSSGPTIIAACNNVAYTFISGRQSGDTAKQVVFELVPTNHVESQQGKENTRTNHQIEGEDIINNESKITHSYTIDDQKKENSIQAVACYWKVGKSELLYAISRCDKTVDIYKISEDDIQSVNDANTTINKINPILSHNTVKRCCSLAFASIPSQDSGKEPSMIIVAGDLNGDATAYMTEDQENVKSSQVGRVLLGHTASVLTSIEIVDDQSGWKMFTSDRDEKVRISSFPQTFHVQGYLLGNTSYISDVKVVRNKMTKCVTCSGDGKMRLFDYESYKEDAMINIPHQIGSDMSHEDEDSNPHIPVRIAINNQGTDLVVIYDALTTVQVFAIDKEPNGGYAFNHIQNIEFQSIPLGVVFDSNDVLNVLTQEEKIVRILCDEDDRTYKVIEDKMATLMKQIIIPSKMPQSLVETDEYGKLKLKKKALEESVAKNEPWLNVGRKERYKESQRRRKRRKKEEQEKDEDKTL